MGLSSSSSSTKLLLPSLAYVKHLPAFSEFPLCSLTQISESYQYYRQSQEYQTHTPTLSLAGFEEIFGQLFPDPSLHFYHLQHNNSVGYIVIVDVFYILTLFCDASNEEKLYFLCNINHDLDLNNLRIDALQLMFYRILQAMTIVFQYPSSGGVSGNQDGGNSISSSAAIPPRDDVYSFLEHSIKQFQDRNRVANANNPYYTMQYNTQGSSEYGTTRPFSFHDFWQWCQDVNQISTYLDAIESICSIVIASVDRSYKGRQYMILRNSFFNLSSMTKATENAAETNATTTSTALQNSLQKALQVVEEQESFTIKHCANYHRHPLWKYTLQDLVSEHWFEDMHTQTTLDSKVFTCLEHMMLSHRHVMPVFVPQGHNPLNPTSANGIPGMPASSGHRFSTMGANSNRSSVSMTPFSSSPNRTSISTFTPKGNNPNPNPFSEALATPTMQTPGNPRSSVSTKGGTPNQNNNNNAPETIQHPVHRMELLSVIDIATVLSWLVICMPSSVLDAYRQQEEDKEAAIRSKRASFDLSTSKKRSTAMILASLRASNPLESMVDQEEEEEGGDIEGDAEAGEEEGEIDDQNGDQGYEDLDGDNPRIVLPSMIRFKQRNKNVHNFRNQWQTVGHVVANSSLLSIFQAETYAHLHRRYDTTSLFHHVYYVHQSIYNVITLIANGYKYIPIGINNRNHGSAITSAPNKLLHILEPYEIATFLFENYDEVFNQYHHHLSEQFHRSQYQKQNEDASPSFTPFRYATQPPSPEKPSQSSSNNILGLMNKSVYYSGFMRKPCCISSSYNIGTALFLLLQSKLDAAVIVNEKNKVCGVLTIQIMQKFWWHWKKQHLPMASMTMNDLRHDYGLDVYNYLYGSSKNEQYLQSQQQQKFRFGSIPASDLYNYSLFSSLMNPIAHGDVIGLEYQDFDDYINEPMPSDAVLSMKLLHGRVHHLQTASIASATTATSMSTEDDESSMATDAMSKSIS